MENPRPIGFLRCSEPYVALSIARMGDNAVLEECDDDK